MKSFFQQYPGQPRLPDLRPLPDGRYQLADYHVFAAPYYERPDYGDLHPFDADLPANEAVYQGMRLIRIEPSTIPGKTGQPLVIYLYEQIPATGFVVSGPEQVDYDLNGLERIARPMIGLTGQALPSEWVVGTMEADTGSERYLAQIKVERDVAVQRVTLVFLQAGVISKSVAPGPIAGTAAHTWQTWILDATDEADMGVGETIPGELLRTGNDNVEGYLVRSWSSIAGIGEGTITGVKTTWADNIEVRTPGTVVLDTVAITAGDLSGTDAIIKHTPPRAKTVTATVTVEITDTPPTTAALAYNLENISCSVTNTRASYSYVGSDVYTTVNGNNSLAVPKYRASIGASISTFPGSYISGSTTATGAFSYTAGSSAEGLDTNTILVTAITANVTNTLTGTGATAATGYTTTGVVQRKVRPVLTTLAGVTYWEVVTWTV